MCFSVYLLLKAKGRSGIIVSDNPLHKGKTLVSDSLGYRGTKPTSTYMITKVISEKIATLSQEVSCQS